MFLLISTNLYAVDKYVRKGASGSGTSWSDAWDDLDDVSWTGLGGYTLWIAAGSYTGQLTTINTANVTVKRATVENHGTETGWSAAYDDQVTVNPSANFLVISSGADGLTLDGVSNNPWKFRVVGISGYNGMLRNDGADSVTIRNIEFDGNSENPGGTNSFEDGLRWMGGSDAIIEYCYIHDYRQVGDEHMDGVQGPAGTDITFRYNIFMNNGMHLFLGDYEWNASFVVDGASIHHNLFYNESGITASNSYNTIVFKGLDSSADHPTLIENNTFTVRSSEAQAEGYRMIIVDSGGNDFTYGYFRNNILYDATLGWVEALNNSYNSYYLSGTPPGETGEVTTNPLFTSYAGNDFTLQSGSPCKFTGTDLAYDTDILGVTIPDSPSMGAYEYDAGGAPSIIKKIMTFFRRLRG